MDVQFSRDGCEDAFRNTTSYRDERIFLALRSGGSGGTHCLVEVAMLDLYSRDAMK